MYKPLLGPLKSGRPQTKSGRSWQIFSFIPAGNVKQ